MATKQVLVWRNDLKGVPLGKKMAQGGHGPHMFITEQIRRDYPGAKLRVAANGKGKVTIELTQAEMDWIMDNYKKVYAFVNSEQELLTLEAKAKELGIATHLVIDQGLTVFTEPTKTVLAIGPDDEEKVDLLTGEKGPLGKLRLL